MSITQQALPAGPRLTSVASGRRVKRRGLYDRVGIVQQRRELVGNRRERASTEHARRVGTHSWFRIIEASGERGNRFGQ